MLCTVVTFWKRYREVEEVKLTTLVCSDFGVLRNNLKILPVLQDMWQYHFLNVYSDKRSQIWFDVIFRMVNPTVIENLAGPKFNGLRRQRRQLLLRKHLGGINLGIGACHSYCCTYLSKSVHMEKYHLAMSSLGYTIKSCILEKIRYYKLNGYIS